MHGCIVAPILAAHPPADTVTLSSVLPINAIVSARDFVALSRIVNLPSGTISLSSVAAVIVGTCCTVMELQDRLISLAGNWPLVHLEFLFTSEKRLSIVNSSANNIENDSAFTVFIENF